MASIKKNFIYQALWQILSMILPLVTSPLLARTLGAEGIGIYAYISSIVGYFALVANFGISKYGIRAIAAVSNDKEKRSAVFWEIWYLHSILSILIGILYFIYAWNYSEYRQYFCIMGMQYIGNILSIHWLFAGMEDFKKITIRDALVKLATFILIVAFIRDKTDLVNYILIMSFSGLIGNGIFWISKKKYIQKVPVNWENIFYHMKGFMILFVPVLLESIYVMMDKVMLGTLSTKTAVGFYENAEKALISNRIIHALTIVVMPRTALLIANEATHQIDVLMKKAVDLSIFLSVAFSFGTAAIAKEFSVIFWGKKFMPCADLIVIMAMSMPAMALSRLIREGYLIPAKEDRKYMLSAGSGALFNFMINLIFIPKLGAVAAAISTLVAEYAVLVVQIITVRGKLSIVKYIISNLIYLIFGIVMFYAVRLVGNFFGIALHTLLIEIVVGIVVYLSLCCIYWNITDQKYFYEVAQKYIKKFFGKKILQGGKSDT